MRIYSYCWSTKQKSYPLLLKFNWTEVTFVSFTDLNAEEFATIRDHSLTAINKIVLCLPLWGRFSYNLFVKDTNSFMHVLDFVKSRIKAEFYAWSWEFLHTRICYKYFGTWLISCWRLLKTKQKLDLLVLLHSLKRANYNTSLLTSCNRLDEQADIKMRSYGFWQLVDDKSVSRCQQTFSKLIVKACYPQACCKLI